MEIFGAWHKFAGGVAFQFFQTVTQRDPPPCVVMLIILSKKQHAYVPDWFHLRTRCSLDDLDPHCSFPTLFPGCEAFLNLTSAFINYDLIYNTHISTVHRRENEEIQDQFCSLLRSISLQVTKTITSHLRQAAATHVLGAIWVWREETGWQTPHAVDALGYNCSLKGSSLHMLLCLNDSTGDI